MLSGPTFRSVFVFSINSLILSGFPLTFFHLAETSLSASLFRCFILLSVQLSKNIRKLFYLYLFTFLVFILQSTCFICIPRKRKQTMEQQPNRVRERTKSKQKQNQARHIQIDHAVYCSIQPTNNSVVSLKDGFPV